MKSYQVIIIGAGVAGSLMAAKLAKSGIKTLIIEAGLNRSENRLQMSGRYAMTTRKTPGSPYFSDNNIESPDFREITNPKEQELHYYDFEKTSEGKPIKVFKSSYQRIIGGSTWHWLGNTPRFLPNDFKIKSLYSIGKDWPISYADLEPYYCEAEKELGISGNHEKWDNYLGAYRSKPFPMSEIWQCYGDSKFIEAIEGEIIQGHTINILPTPQARNSENYRGRPPCAGNSSCVPICPIQAKYDATIHVNQAKENGADLISGAVVHKLHTNELNSIVKLTYRTSGLIDREIDTEGKIVILAAHTIESAKILLMSDVANSSKMVGKNLMDHAQGYVVAKLNTPIYPFRGPLTTSGIDIFRDGNNRKKHSAFRLSIGNDGWGRVKSPNNVARQHILQGKTGKELFNDIGNEIIRLSRISYSTEVLPDEKNTVTLSKLNDKMNLPRPKLSFTINDYNKRAFTFARKICKEIFEKVGVNEIDTLENRSFSGAGHIMGTTCMGKDPKKSVVNSDCRSHDNDNLYIIGASVFPTSGTANPTLTVAALSLRAADLIIQKFKDDTFV